MRTTSSKSTRAKSNRKVHEMQRKLGHVQVSVLRQIAMGDGRALHAMLDLRGQASTYSGRYKTAVANAIHRHNTGRCGDDCPIPQDHRVVGASVGPLGGFGYRIEEKK
jgi:hypothetical protein